MNLAAIDLNLLLVLSVVLEEKSATRAARRLNVTQSAVSNALSRLRELLGDPLMVRNGRGLVPTPRALELAPLLGAAMDQLRAAIEKSDFDPRETSRQFTLACADAQQIRDVPAIAAALVAEMPRATLRVVSIDYLLATDGLATGEVDLAFAPPSAREGLHYQTLYHDDAMAVVRKDHPQVGARLSKRLFNTLEHVDILLALGRAGRGHDELERVLAEQGLHRRIVLSVPSFASALMVAATTDLIAGIPRSVTSSLAPHLPVKVLAIPARGLTVEVGMIWHPRTDADPICAHFRRVVAAIFTPRRSKPLLAP